MESRRTFGLAALTLTLMVTSCAGSTSATETGVACAEPPSSELEQTSELALLVEPNPVAAGTTARLSMELDGLPADAIVGAGVEWQCWNGSDWVPTHQIIRAFNDFDPSTIEVAPGATTTVVAIGLSIPNSYEIIIPNVVPGTYRIADKAIVSGAEVSGFVLVEVD